MEPTEDIEVADFLQMELYHDEMMADSEITVKIDGGIATLTGTAKSLAQIERATARAYSNREVLSVVNMVSVQAAPNSTIGPATKALLANQKMLDASAIKVASEGSRVILNGEVGSLDESELARELASQTTGVTGVVNNLSVNFLSIRSDEQIAAQLAFEVSDDPIYAGLDIVPTVREGEVFWNGEVGSRGEFSRLIRISYVTGVIEVHANQLAINSDLKMEETEDKDYTPSQSVEAFTASVSADPRLSGTNIRGEFVEGTMIVSGTVETASQSDAAEMTARGIPGILTVNNQLVLSGSQKFASTGQTLISADVPVLTRPE